MINYRESQAGAAVRVYCKTLNELEIKAAIEVALFRKATELELMNMAMQPGKVHRRLSQTCRDLSISTCGDETVFLKDIFSDILLFLYIDPSVRIRYLNLPLKRVEKRSRLFFAYHLSTLHKYFLHEIQTGALFIRKIKKGELFLLPRILEKCTATLPRLVRRKTPNPP